MLKRTLRKHPLHDSFIGSQEVQDIVQSLLEGGSINNVPSNLLPQVISALTSRRKTALLHNQDSVAEKIDAILGEITHGPNSVPIATKASSVRNRSLTVAPEVEVVTRNLISGGERIDSIDPVTRNQVPKSLRNHRILEVSKGNYNVSRSIDQQIDSCHEYNTDSRRIAPLLIRIQEIEKRLSDSRAKYEEIRASCHKKLQHYTQLEKAAEDELDAKLNSELVEYGSKLPTTLPLEYQKFSSKVLDKREKELKSAQVRLYDDAKANHNAALELEKEELRRNNDLFTKAFKMNREVLLKSQQQKREGFKEIWRRKKDKVTSELNQEIQQAKKAMENLEKEKENAKMAYDIEVARIKNHQKQLGKPTPTFGA